MDKLYNDVTGKTTDREFPHNERPFYHIVRCCYNCTRCYREKWICQMDNKAISINLMGRCEYYSDNRLYRPVSEWAITKTVSETEEA